MTEYQEYIRSKEIKDYSCNLHDSLVDSYYSKNKLSNLSEHQALIDLIIQKKLVAIENICGYPEDSKQIKLLKENCSLEDLWNEETYPILEFYFGDEMAKHVKTAWYA